MSTLALHQTDREFGVASPVVQGLGRSWSLMVMFALAFPIVFYLLLLAILVIEYGHLPNYLTFYDWFATCGTSLPARSRLPTWCRSFSTNG